MAGAVRRPRSEIATDINVEAARLYDLVEDLLALTRVERELLEMTDEPVSLPRAVEVAVRTVSSRTPEVADHRRRQRPIPPAVRGDADYVEHAVRNLHRVGDPASAGSRRRSSSGSSRARARSPSASSTAGPTRRRPSCR